MLFDFLRLLNIVFFLICDHFVLELVRRTKTPDPSHLILQLLDLVHIVDHALCLLPPHLQVQVNWVKPLAAAMLKIELRFLAQYRTQSAAIHNVIKKTFW